MVLIAVLAFHAGLAAAASNPLFTIADGINQTSHSVTCLSFADTQGPLGQAVQRRCTQHAQQEFARQPDRRTLQDCIKPGNVIDDDVRNCMKGL
jgi:hypothetical protein